MFFLGADGGGTKTEAVMMDAQLDEIARFTVGPINLNGNGKKTVEESMRDLFEQVGRVRPLPECKRVCIGMAGISNPDAERTMREAVALFFGGELMLMGDQDTALEGALEGRSGLVVIAGTGSICIGKTGDGVKKRAGGYGNIIDDGGSGYAIGRDILSAVVRAYDGRGAETVLTGLVRERLTELGFSKKEDPDDVLVGEIIKFLYDERTTKRDIAAFSALIANALKERDRVSQDIAQKAAQDLVLLAETVISKLSGEKDIRLAYSGSVLVKNGYIRERFTESIKKEYEWLDIVPALHDAAYGAGLAAARQGE